MDFLKCQKIAELLTAYQIDPERVRVLFYTCRDGEGGEKPAVAVRSREDNTQVELDALRKLHSDLGIDDSEAVTHLFMYTDHQDLIARLKPLIEKQNLAKCVAQLSKPVQR